MIIDLNTCTTPEAFHLMTSTIIPRPIAWVLSENEDSSLNIAPYSFFNGITSNPPLLMISAGINPDGTHKDTLCNIRDRDQCVIHIVSLDQINDMNYSSHQHPAGVSEVELLGLKTTHDDEFRLPRITDCKVAYSCSLHDIHYVGNNSQALILVEIHHIFLDDTITGKDEKGRLTVSAKQINPAARLGPGQYASLGELVHLQKPK